MSVHGYVGISSTLLRVLWVEDQVGILLESPFYVIRL